MIFEYDEALKLSMSHKTVTFCKWYELCYIQNSSESKVKVENIPDDINTYFASRWVRKEKHKNVVLKFSKTNKKTKTIVDWHVFPQSEIYRMWSGLSLMLIRAKMLNFQASTKKTNGSQNRMVWFSWGKRKMLSKRKWKWKVGIVCEILIGE